MPNMYVYVCYICMIVTKNKKLIVLMLITVTGKWRNKERKQMKSHYPLSTLCIWMRIGCLQKVYTARCWRHWMTHSNSICFFTLASLIRFVRSAFITSENILFKNRCSKELMWTSMTAGLCRCKSQKNQKNRTCHITHAAQRNRK